VKVDFFMYALRTIIVFIYENDFVIVFYFNFYRIYLR
jgi:hypothetical protein